MLYTCISRAIVLATPHNADTPHPDDNNVRSFGVLVRGRTYHAETDHVRGRAEVVKENGDCFPIVPRMRRGRNKIRQIHC